MEEEGISKLPEEIIQHILCNFLSAKEAAQARLLSKAWLTGWQTCPVLTFEQPYFEREFVTPDERKRKQHMFRVFVDKVLLNYQEKKIGIHTFKLRMRLGYDSSDNESVNEWMKVAAGNGLKKLHLSVVFSSYILPPTILETKSLEDLFLQGCIFEHQLRGGVMCSNLRATGSQLRTIQLNNLAKLKELSVYYNQEQSVELMTKLPHVEDLKITSCDLLNTVKISSESLKLIQLKFNKKLEELQVDAPNIVRFACMGASIPRVGLLLPQFTDFVYYLLLERSIHWREIKFWYNHLKDVKVVIMKRTGTKWQPEIFGWKSLLDVEPNNSSGVQRAISFNLEW
ncbi:F-box protein At3g59000-like [Coffea eugenioides]|uniref:F-box protein At3g59000-like n=1 Tax=Coffea eugenioides TaxID=49369 RepID=UPI000F6120EB|nr:F-box protein At3g59000-like [Coffea eugenioides]